MARKVLTQAEMIAIIQAGGSVLINCPNHTILATKVEQVPDDAELLECFPATPLPAFDPDDLYANAIGILGKFFSGSPSGGDTIVYDAVDGVWEFTQNQGFSVPLGTTLGGTGLTTIPANSILYAGSLNTLSSTTLGDTLGVTSGILNVVNDSSTQKIEVAGNNNLFGSRKRINFLNGANTTVSVVDDSVNNKVDITISASSSAGTRWDLLADPTGNLGLTMGSSDTTFTWGNATAGNSLFKLKDSNGNTGNGYILDLSSGTASTINLFRATVSGNSNGVVIDSTGKLAAIGTGNVEASQLKGVGGTGIAIKTGSGFVVRSLATSSPDLSITNADGVSGNITINFGTSVVTGVSSDTNINGSISSNILTLGWTGRLAKSRQYLNTVYNDQDNIYVAGNKQSFSPNSVNAGLNVGFFTSDPSALSNGDFWGNSSTGRIKFYEAGTAYDLLQIVKGQKNLLDGSSVSLFEIDLSPLTACAIIINYALVASDGTNIQSRSGSIRFSAVNKAGTITTEQYISTEGIAPSIGTLTVTWDFTVGVNKITVKALGDSSLTPNTFHIFYSVDNLSDRIITKL